MIAFGFNEWLITMCPLFINAWTIRNLNISVAYISFAFTLLRVYALLRPTLNEQKEMKETDYDKIKNSGITNSGITNLDITSSVTLSKIAQFANIKIQRSLVVIKQNVLLNFSKIICDISIDSNDMLKLLPTDHVEPQYYIDYDNIYLMREDYRHYYHNLPTNDINHDIKLINDLHCRLEKYNGKFADISEAGAI